ncbi:MHYT domain-containing protein [Streptomyces sp. SM11]|uniref:MHYT domain-containing protein n=1 Tax=Streptomyces sp. SM11 TaxID=565557 RepID=UPI000CD5BB5B|nr:MHYT domain-containing protein [Streptomyces sp. SM11]
METTVSNFHYGAVTPVAAFLMACLGAALGLRCTTRAIRRDTNRVGWLALGSVSIGCGIWTMHFIAMAGFTIDGMSMKYDSVMTLLSLLVAIAVVAVGVFLVGFRGPGTVVLTTAGVFTGLGVAAMHYLGMAAMHTPDDLRYSYATVALSILIAVVAATAALWAAVSVHGLWASLGASLIMGVAVTGMHYTGMAALDVPSGSHGAGTQSSVSLLSFLLVMLTGPLAALIVSAVIVIFDGDVIMGSDERGTHSRLRHTSPPPWQAETVPPPIATHATDTTAGMGSVQ